MDIKEATVQLVKDLYASENGLLPFTLYRRYGVTPKVLVDIVKGLQEKCYLQLGKDNRLILTPKGRENAEGIIANQKKNTGENMDSEFFINIAGILMGKREPFLPSKQFFEKYNREGDENG